MACGWDHSRRIYDLSRKDAQADEKAVLKAAYTKKKRGILLFAVLLHIGMLLFLKYFDFFGQNANQLLSLLNLPEVIPTLKLAVPLGISFYTMQAVSYVTDVYHGKIEADDNLGRLALYMSFFRLSWRGRSAGIPRLPSAFMKAVRCCIKNAAYGYQRIIWGLFKKMVIADRLNPLVAKIFDNYGDYGGAIVVMGAVLYTFQLYADFSGCIDITIGAGEIFGVKIPENFRQPFSPGRLPNSGAAGISR